MQLEWVRGNVLEGCAYHVELAEIRQAMGKFEAASYQFEEYLLQPAARSTATYLQGLFDQIIRHLHKQCQFCVLLTTYRAQLKSPIVHIFFSLQPAPLLTGSV